MKNFRKNVLKSRNGITLIALVITIIVLLILAGISISMLSGDNGLLKRAGDARDDTVVGQEKEQVELAYVSAAVKKLGDNVDKDDLQDELDLSVGKRKTTVTGSGTLKVKFEDTKHEYTVNDGKVAKIESGNQLNSNTVTNPYSSENYAVAWTYSENNGWDNEYEPDWNGDYGDRWDESNLTGDIVAKLYLKGEDYHLVIEKIGENGTMGAVGARKAWRQPWCSNELTNVVVCDGISGIGDTSFYSCYNLTNVEISSSVTSIGNNAFAQNGDIPIVINIHQDSTSLSNEPWLDQTYDIDNVSIEDTYNMKIKWNDVEHYYFYSGNESGSV